MNRESRSGFSAAAWTGTFKNQSVQDEESFRIFRSIEFESLNAKQAALRGFLCFWRNRFYERKRRKWLLRSGFSRWVFKGVEKKAARRFCNLKQCVFEGKDGKATVVPPPAGLRQNARRGDSLFNRRTPLSAGIQPVQPYKKEPRPATLFFCHFQDLRK